MYCLYFRLRDTWTSPTLLLFTFLFLVVSKPANPMIFIISISSLVFPSKSFSVSIGGSATGAESLALALLLPAPLSPDLARSRDLLRFLSLSRDRDLFLRRSLLSSRSRLLLVSLILSLDLLRDPRRLRAGDRDLLLLLGILTII